MQNTVEALVESRKIISAAQAEADRIISVARATAESIKQAAYNSGVADGKARGIIEISQLEAARTRVLKSATGAIAEVVSLVVQELVPSLSLELSQISHRIGLAVEQLAKGSLINRLTLVIHPSARELVQQLIAKENPFPGEIEYSIREDEALGEGVCRIETATSVIESDIHNHANRILQYLRANAHELFAPSIGPLFECSLMDSPVLIA